MALIHCCALLPAVSTFVRTCYPAVLCRRSCSVCAESAGCGAAWGTPSSSATSGPTTQTLWCTPLNCSRWCVLYSVLAQYTAWHECHLGRDLKQHISKPHVDTIGHVLWTNRPSALPSSPCTWTHPRRHPPAPVHLAALLPPNPHPYHPTNDQSPQSTSPLRLSTNDNLLRCFVRRTPCPSSGLTPRLGRLWCFSMYLGADHRARPGGGHGPGGAGAGPQLLMSAVQTSRCGPYGASATQDRELGMRL